MALLPSQSEGVTTHTSYETSTNDPSESDYIASALSVFGHREAFAESPDPRRCDLRMRYGQLSVTQLPTAQHPLRDTHRLTPSKPYKQGAVWRRSPVPLSGGFEAGFSFQISDHSRVCRRVRDKAFSTRLYESCMVHGGDGFAFVLHNDANRTKALGVDGERLGYTGIRNAIAVEFDTWYNPDIGDLFHDHISLQASGPLAPLASNQSQLMGAARPHPLADGKVHSVKLQYFPHLKYELLEHFSATPQLVPFLKDAGESRRIGTFVVYIDNMTTPLTAVPINLNVAMDLPDGQAYVGFTASTGKAWERHDMLSWYFCEYPGCPRSGLGPVDWQATLDFMDEDEVNPR